MSTRRAGPAGPEPARGRARLRSLLLAGLLGLTVLAPVACRKASETPTPPEQDGTLETEAELVGERPSLPARAAGLASQPVFPEVDRPLELLRAEPADGAEGVAVGAEEARIVLRFNHPVVPLALPDAGERPVPARIEPELPGQGEWLDSATWLFTPAEDLRPATEYRLELDPELEDFFGARLAEPTRLSFVTAGPAVLRSRPESGAIDAAATRPISITFNQAMDRGSTEAAFRLAPAEALESRSLAGRFEWPDPSTLLFTPEAELERDAAYRVTIAAGARAASAEAESPEPMSWTFRTAPRPALVSSDPADGEGSATGLRRGDLRLQFNTPMDREALTVTVEPTITHLGIWWSEEGREAHVTGGWLASRRYTVTLPADTPSRGGDPLGEALRIRFEAAPMAPNLHLHTTGSFSQFQASEPVRVYIDAVNRDAAELALHGIDAASFLALTTGEGRWQLRDDFVPEEGELLRRWTLDTRAPVDVQRRISATLAAAGEERLAPGLYHLAVGHLGQAARERQKTMLAVSDVHLSLKLAPGEVLVWATELDSGRPVAGLELAVYETAEQRLASGRTDADGVFRAPIERQAPAWEPLVVLAEAEDGRVLAAVSSEWTSGIEPYAFDFGYDPDPRRYYGTVYTDRPLYRPGQTVYFRGALREDEDARYRLPEAERVRLIVRDPDWETLQETELPLSDFGTFDGSIELSPLARLGGYQIEVSLPVEADEEPVTVAGAGFRLAAYRKPAFELEVRTDRPEYLAGETMAVTAEARYFFGGPVADAELRWRLMADDFFFQPPEVEGRWDWIDYDLTEARYHDAQGEVLAEGEGRTDDEGRFELELPADLSEFPLSQVFTIEVEVTDLDQSTVAGRGSAVAHAAELYLGLRPQRYLGRAGEPADFDLLALDPQGEGVADRAVALELYRREWYSVREQREDGGYYWTSHYTDTLVAEAEARTDEVGRAEVSLATRSAGVHRLVARAEDEAGRQARSATYLWVTGSGYVNWRQENNDRIELVADKRLYAPGETARILVPAPFEGAQALVTLERGGIQSVRRVELAGNGETIEIPIEDRHAPNVYVSVLLIKGVGPDSPLPQMKLGYTNLAVSTAARELDIEIQADRTGDYGPRQAVTWTVSARDAQGRPARAELSLALVDEALLALTSEDGPSLEQTFYGQRMLSVGTAAGLTQFGRRLERELAAERKGGGGGGPAGEGGTVRRLMEDTAFWMPALRTDDQGRAQVSLRLPDNLTTWRMEARGLTADETLVGTARETIRSTQDVLIQPVLPRFLVVGDTLQVEAVVQNRSAEDLDLELRLETIGPERQGAAGQPLRLPAGGKRKLVWQIELPEEGYNPPTQPEAYGEARLLLSALAEDERALDAIEVDLPVYRFSSPELVASAGLVEDRVTERIQLPEGYDESQGGLEITLEPSLAASALAGLRWLEDRPEDCAETVASRLLARLGAWQVLAVAPPDAPIDPALRQQLEEAIPLDLQRLAAQQGPAGGWGWCDPGAEPQAWLSAQALLAQSLAEEAGFAVSARSLESATAYLQAELDAPIDAEAAWDLDQRAFFAWVLARREAIALGRILSLDERRGGMGADGLSFLALALDRRGVPESAGRLSAVLAELSSRAARSARGAWWAEDPEPWTLATGRRSTAIAILALASADPEASVLPGALRWLMAERREGHWETSQETAWSVLALAAWLDASGELDAAQRYHVELNATELGSGELAAATVDEALTFSVPAEDLESVNDLTIRRDGRGRLGYQAALRLYRPAESLPPLDAGIVLGREYRRVDPVRFEPVSGPVDRVRVGELVEVRLTLVADESLRFLRLQDYVPAGFEIVDTSLQSTSAAARGPALEQGEGGADSDLPWWRRAWWLSWSESQLLDDRALLLAERLEPGSYVYRYLLRARVAGVYHVRPALAELSWFPEVFGRSAGGVFVIEAAD